MTRLALRLYVAIAYTAAVILPILVQVTIRPPSDDDRPECELDDVLPHSRTRKALAAMS